MHARSGTLPELLTWYLLSEWHLKELPPNATKSASKSLQRRNAPSSITLIEIKDQELDPHLLAHLRIESAFGAVNCHHKSISGGITIYDK